MAKKKDALTEFSLESYSAAETKDEVTYKPDSWVELDPVLAKTFNMPGIKMGTMSGFFGLSNSGKTTLLLIMAVRAQQQGKVPILIITENKMDWGRAQQMGLDISKNACIIREDLEYLEDVYDYISQKVEDVKKGRLARDVVILWDSVAATPSKESLEIDESGKIKKKFTNQKNANVIGYYNPTIAKRINSTRQDDSAFSLALVMLTQAYIKPAEFAGGMATIVPNGGEKIWFPLTLMGRVKEGMPLKSTVKGRQITYGTVCKIDIVKNHINGLLTSGEFVITSDSLLENDPEVLKQYKENNKSKWESLLSDPEQEQ